jgi:PHD/YefM family antitoxin component YafN of YafNO toxin-antitoxin module
MESDQIPPRDLQSEKLELEILELKKSWYKKPAYLSILLTAFIALATILATLKSGIIDKERKTLELQKAILTFDIREFELKKKHLVDSIKVFKDSVLELRRKEVEFVLKYKEYKKREELYIQRLQGEVKKDELIKYYQNRLDSLMKRRIFDQTFDKTFN